MQTRNQKLAVKVFQKIENLQREFPNENSIERKKYGAMAHKLPVLIRTAGLAQALGFLDAKSKKESEMMNKRLLGDLASTLGKSSADALLSQSRGNNNQSLGDYLRLTQETLAALLWYKRFAQSVLGVEQGEQTGD
jgi:CRISPR-associated protein Cmr5